MVSNDIKGFPILNSKMISRIHLLNILEKLKTVIYSCIDGDIVELGCNVGTTSLFIQRLLEEYNSGKKFYVYDSFRGLPEKHRYDESQSDQKYYKGSCKTDLETFVHNFKKASLSIPTIKIGWFKEFKKIDFPEKICFAFLDGDFYTSIIDSLEQIYEKMEPKGIILIHDYNWSPLPGVKKACDDFFKNRSEKVVEIINGLGMVIKE